MQTGLGGREGREEHSVNLVTPKRPGTTSGLSAGQGKSPLLGRVPPRAEEGRGWLLASCRVRASCGPGLLLGAALGGQERVWIRVGDRVRGRRALGCVEGGAVAAVFLLPRWIWVPEVGGDLALSSCTPKSGCCRPVQRWG